MIWKTSQMIFLHDSMLLSYRAIRRVCGGRKKCEIHLFPAFMEVMVVTEEAVEIRDSVTLVLALILLEVVEEMPVV
jgi:hypothetical protein